MTENTIEEANEEIRRLEQYIIKVQADLIDVLLHPKLSVVEARIDIDDYNLKNFKKR